MVILVNPANAAQALERGFVADVATEAVARVGGIGDHAAGADNIRGLADQSWLRIFRMNREKLGHGKMDY
jgi:hypothetical protein